MWSLRIILAVWFILFALHRVSAFFSLNMGIVYLNHALDSSLAWPEVENHQSLHQAQVWLRRATESGSEFAPYWLGVTLAAAERGEDAVQAWRLMEGMAPNLILWGKLAGQANQYEKALRWFKGATQVEPDNRDPWYFVGTTHTSLGELDKAIWAWQEGLECNQGREVGHSNLYFQIGYARQYGVSPPDVEGAWIAYERALALDDYLISRERVETYYRRGILLGWQGRWEEAITEYEQALTLKPNHYGVLLYLASTFQKLGDTQKAEGVYLRAIQVQPRSKWAYFWLGGIYEEIGKWELAVEMYNTALELDTNDETIRTALDKLETRLRAGE